jgi:hypothetical protein
MSKQSSQQKMLGRDGSYCVVEPACPELFRTLYTLRHNAELDAAGVCRVISRPYPLVWQQHDAAGHSQSVCYVGLEPIVREQLRQLGYTVQRLLTPCKVLPPAQHLPWELAENVDESFLTMVQQCERGMVHFDTCHVEPARLIAEAAMAWRRHRIVVPVTRSPDAWNLRAALAKFVPAGEIGVYAGGAVADEHKRIVIGTYQQLGGGAVALHERQLLFALSPCEMLANDFGRQVVAAARSARCYGFMPINAKVPPYQRDQLRALFGKQSISIPAHGKVQRPVNVFFTPVYGGPTIGEGLAWPELKAKGVWEHPIRNRRITGLAQALAAKDTRVIATRFPDTVSGVRQLNKARIGVLTENVDHALKLGRRLPDWPILAGKSLALDGLTPADMARLQQGRGTSRRTRHVIVTVAGLCDVGRLDYVIRADAGIGIPDVDLSVNTYVNGRPRAMTIIDFDDLHNSELRQRSQQRRRDYLDAGWRLPLQQPTELELFLNSRPKVQWR